MRPHASTKRAQRIATSALCMPGLQRPVHWNLEFAVVTLDSDVSEYGWLGLGYTCDVRQYQVVTAG